MKKFVLLIIAAMALWGCSKINNPIPDSPFKASVTGKWFITKDTTIYYTIPGNQVESKLYNIYHHTSYWQFNTDGTGQSVINPDSTQSQTNTFTYSLTSNLLLINVNSGTDAAGNPLAGYTLAYSIKWLTGSYLEFQYNGVMHASTQDYAIEKTYLIK